MARVVDERLHVVEERVRHLHGGHRLLQLLQLRRRHGGREVRDQLAPLRPAQELALRLRVRVAQADAHEEAVELRLGQREGAHLVERVLRRDHEERVRQRPGRALRGHLVLLHRLQEGALRLRARPVDLVGEDDVREDGAGVEAEGRGRAIEDGDPDDVGRQQVRGELDALVLEPQELCEGMGEGGLAHARDVLDQQVPAREDAGDREPDLALLAEDHLSGRGDDGFGGTAGDAAAGVDEHGKSGTLSAVYGWMRYVETRISCPRRAPRLAGRNIPLGRLFNYISCRARRALAIVRNEMRTWIRAMLAVPLLAWALSAP